MQEILGPVIFLTQGEGWGCPESFAEGVNLCVQHEAGSEVRASAGHMGCFIQVKKSPTPPVLPVGCALIKIPLISQTLALSGGWVTPDHFDFEECLDPLACRGLYVNAQVGCWLQGTAQQRLRSAASEVAPCLCYPQFPRLAPSSAVC